MSPPKFTPEETEEFRALFNQFDTDKTGDIDAQELGNMLTELGLDVTVSDVDELLRTVDKDGAMTIDFDEFLQVIWRYRSGGESDEDEMSPTSQPVSRVNRTEDPANYLPPEQIQLMDSYSPEELSSKLEMFLNMKDSLREVFAEARPTNDATVVASAPPAAAKEKPEKEKEPTDQKAAPASPQRAKAAKAPPKADPERARRMSAHNSTIKLVMDSLQENGFPFTFRDDGKMRRETPDSTAKALINYLGYLTDYLQKRLSLSVDYVEVGVHGFEDDRDTLRVKLDPVDQTQVELELDDLKHFAFEETIGAASRQGADAFRFKAKDFPFFMFPIETICEQLNLVDRRYDQYINHIGLNDFLLRPKCPKGLECEKMDDLAHRQQMTHPCYSGETPCPHSNRQMHMKCFLHGTESENLTKENALKELSRLLGVLDIGGFEIGDSGGHCLAYVLSQDHLLPKDQRKYRELRAPGNHFSPSGAIPIIDFAHDLVRLDLSCNGLGYRGSLLIPGGGVGPSLHQLLTRSERLTHLNLSRNRLSDNEMRFIADGLKYNSVLKHLDLRKNEFGPGCGELLAAAMSDNRYLSELLLGWNRLESAGTLELLNELQSSSTVEVLDLSWTGVTDEGGKCIARMIAGSTALVHLDISHNGVGKGSAPLISKALQQNKTLLHLDISYNPLGDRGTTEIIRDIRENAVLEYLDLRCTKARDEAHKEIQQTLRLREPKMPPGVQQKILFERELPNE
jgi:hypothetical protein